MRKTVPWCLLVGGLAYFLARSPGGAARAQESEERSSPAVGAGLAGSVVRIEQDVHLLSGDKTFDVAAGSYAVEPDGTDKLRLVPRSGKAIVLPALLSKHAIRVHDQAALCHGDAEKDRFDLALFLEDGRLLSVVGSFSGARGRGDVSDPWGVTTEVRFRVNGMQMATGRTSYAVPKKWVQLDLSGLPTVGAQASAKILFYPDGQAVPDPLLRFPWLEIYLPMAQFTAVLETLKLGSEVDFAYMTFNNGGSWTSLSASGRTIPWVQ